jgi:hypothetical protein
MVRIRWPTASAIATTTPAKDAQSSVRNGSAGADDVPDRAAAAQPGEPV